MTSQYRRDAVATVLLCQTQDDLEYVFHPRFESGFVAVYGDVGWLLWSGEFAFSEYETGGEDG